MISNQNIVKRLFYLDCLIELPIKINFSNEQIKLVNCVKQGINFLLQKYHPFYEGITIKLVNFISNKENYLFLNEIIEYVKRENETKQNIFLYIIVDVYNMPNGLVNQIINDNICWETEILLDRIDDSSLENYFYINNITTHKNKGIFVTYDSLKISYKEVFSELYKKFYGSPITLVECINLETEKNKLIQDYVDFADYLLEQLINFEFDMTVSFLDGRNFLGSIIKKEFKKYEEINSDVENVHTPCVCINEDYSISINNESNDDCFENERNFYSECEKIAQIFVNELHDKEKNVFEFFLNKY